MEAEGSGAAVGTAAAGTAAADCVGAAGAGTADCVGDAAAADVVGEDGTAYLAYCWDGIAWDEEPRPGDGADMGAEVEVEAEVEVDDSGNPCVGWALSGTGRGEEEAVAAEEGVEVGVVEAGDDWYDREEEDDDMGAGSGAERFVRMNSAFG